VDNEIRQYKEEIGDKEYHNLYCRLYSISKNIKKHNCRCSGSDPDINVDLDKIKEKYKDGVTKDILSEWLF
jgi:hypothetical protein